MAVIEFKQLNFKSSNRYYASADGDIYSKTSKGFKRLSQYPDKDGYMRCCLTVNSKQYRKNVHALILTAFVGERPKGFVCRHLDGNKRNNNLQNLMWGTQKDNIYDCKLHGTLYEGEKHYRVTISDAVVRTVRISYANGMTQKQISEKLSIPKHSVHSYVRGKSRRSAGCL